MLSFLFFLSGGLFLGWSLGANDASNVFGTAVGTKMIRFRTAALFCSVFVIIGAVFAGAGATRTLGKLGTIGTLQGAFAVSLSAALCVYLMTRARLPVSTSQAIVGGIIGWNLFSGNPTDPGIVRTIVLTWAACPLLAAGLAIILYYLFRFGINRLRISILRLDVITRTALILAGIFGSFSLGANNIANVVGVFTAAVPFREVRLGPLVLNGAQQLFFLGGLAIAAGIFTYSRKVMTTVGKDLFSLSPQAAFISVLSHSLVLYLFASQGLRSWLLSHNLPALPLVPVSSSQAIVGAVAGIGIAKNGGKNIKFAVLGRIFAGWIATPVLTGIFSFLLLHILKNMFFPEL